MIECEGSWHESRFDPPLKSVKHSGVPQLMDGKPARINYAGLLETIVSRRVAMVAIVNWEASHGQSKPAVRHTVHVQ